MNKTKWVNIKSKGYKNYLINLGAVKLGVVASIIFMAMFYFSKLSYKVSDFDFSYFAKEYLIWLPLFIIVGIIVAAISWRDFENRYGEK